MISWLNDGARHIWLHLSADFLWEGFVLFLGEDKMHSLKENAMAKLKPVTDLLANSTTKLTVNNHITRYVFENK